MHSATLHRAWRWPGFELSAYAIVLWWAVFVLQWRFGFDAADEGLHWYVAKRVTHGEWPILDWFSYDIGRYYWSSFWFHVLGGSGLMEQRVANLTFGMIGYLAALGCLRHARIPLAIRIATALLLCLMLGFPRHKIYEQGLVLLLAAGSYVVLRHGSLRNWFCFGIATGIAAMFGRNSGVYYLVAAALLVAVDLRDHRDASRIFRIGTVLGLGVVLGYSPMFTLLATSTGFRDAFIASVAEVGSWQHGLPINWPWRTTWTGDLSIYQHQLQVLSLLNLVVPGLYAVTLALLSGRAPRNKKNDLAVGAAIAGIPYLHHAFDRADFAHMAQAAVPMAIVIAAWASIGYSHRSTLVRIGASVASTCALVLAILLWLPFQPRVAFAMHPETYGSLRMQGANIHVPIGFVELIQEADAALSHCVRRDGQLLAAPHSPGLYAALDLRAPYWELYYLHPRPPAIQDAHIAALERAGTGIALFNRESTVDGRPELRLVETYPRLLAHLEAKYTRFAGRPGSLETWIDPERCQR